MNKLILTFTLTILCSLITVDCLKCYVCNDCSTVNDTVLVSCGDSGSVISTTMLPTTITTTIPSTSNETNVSNITTSALETTGITNATTPMTTAQSLTTTTTSPTPPVSMTNTTLASNNTDNNSSIKILPESRTRREVLVLDFRDITPGYRASNTTLVHYCFEGTLKANKEEKRVRGCASRLESSNRTICNDIATESMVTACRTCTTDKCNSAFTTHLSLILLIIATPLSLC